MGIYALVFREDSTVVPNCTMEAMMVLYNPHQTAGRSYDRDLAHANKQRNLIPLFDELERAGKLCFVVL
jgi:hypothetical protein